MAKGGNGTRSVNASSAAGGRISSNTMYPKKLGKLSYQDDIPTGEKWYEGNYGENRVRIMQNTVGVDSAGYYLEINRKIVRTDNGRAFYFNSPRSAYGELQDIMKSPNRYDVNWQSTKRKK